MSKLHETLVAQATRIGELETENECLQRARDAMEWIKTDTIYKAPEQVTVGLLATYISKLEEALTTKKDIGVRPMRQYMKFLGETVRDKVTGVEGTVTSISFDLNGCVQAIIKQRVNKDGKVPDSTWHDVKRLDLIPGKQVMPVPDFGVMPVGSEAGPEDKPVPD